MRPAIGVLFLLVACEDSAPPPEAEPEPELVASDEADIVDSVEAAPDETEPSPTADLPEVDLLRAVAAELGASTAYRSDPVQVGRLVDGDLETAWNSSSGDLTGAWIELRVPDDAQVTAIELTAGFTKTDGDRDLFTLNHRVERVAVSLDGQRMGEHELDVEDRALQRLPVTGSGGVYRITFVGLRPGDNANWREVCVSELRVLGTASGAVEGSRTPSTQIGELGGDVTPDPLAEAEEPEPRDPGEAEVEILRSEGLHVEEIAIATDVVDRQPAERRGTFSRADDDRVYCWVKLANPDRVESEVSFRWESVDRPETNENAVPPRPSRVGNSPNWVTFAYTGTRRRAGRYACVVEDADAEALARATFTLLDE